MREQIEEFRHIWTMRYSYVEDVLTDVDIVRFINRHKSIEQAVMYAYDYVLSNGLADVQE